MTDFKFQAVLFDMDGVILDSMDQHAAAWQRVMAAEGLEVSREFILAHEGCLAEEVLDRLLAEQGRAPRGGEDLPRFMDRLLEGQGRLFQERYAAQVRLYPQAEQVVRAVAARGSACALVTSSQRCQVERALPPDLLRGFTAIIAREDVSRYKPHPDPYLAAMASLDQEPAHCLVVENAPAGIAAGVAAGTTCYALCSTLGPEHLGQAHAVFADLAELAQHLGLDGQA